MNPTRARTRFSLAGRWPAAIGVLTVSVATGSAFGQTPAPAQSLGIWELFRKSFDPFTVALIAGSLVAVAVIIRCMIEIRARVILPPRPLRRIKELVFENRLSEAREFVKRDHSFVSIVLRAALGQRERGAEAMRGAAEMAAGAECARWFRKIELLNVIGNLGPLIGLAGTVWGMVIAFNSLGLAGGDAGPTDLSLGISKALFHTLLGLVLAIPCLLMFGIYRGMVDRLCTRAMNESALLVEQLVPRDEPRAEPVIEPETKPKLRKATG